MQTPTVEAKVVDSNVEACGIITNFMHSRTFAALVTSEEITQNSFQLWKKVNERFASSSFNSKAIIWITLNAKTQGNANAILNVLHEAALEEEALSIDNVKTLALNKEIFPSKTIHYCSNGKHNPLVTTHSQEKCWQLHPKLKTDRKHRNKEQKTNFAIACTIFTHNSRQMNQTFTIVLDTGASNHMFNNKFFF
ncbi:hypothetical protein O181_012158 [Austropuccinia psidii MF-1]|uniref:Uncharacterized protein n=1 Tax=Austropuccinia psidii MF-1 TaxID=1389203 RepID=A0A9Q3BW92_9BASI|nr:hypothetical protein [Austropuccinia psidii MF-1]